MEMAKFGSTAAGGCNRQALTDEDAAGRELFMDWCRQAGCDVVVDPIGNIFARRAGRNMNAGIVMTGSHLDTQPSGGKFDGIYGVLAGLEVIESLNDHDIETDRPFEVVVWTNEEGCRFDPAMMGSAVWSGSLPLEEAYATQDLEGHTVEAELDRIGHKGPARTQQDIHAAFELHIEQGPILETEGKEVGVVTGVQHMCRYRIRLLGQETHAGPSPMPLRRDPMMAVGKILNDLYALADEYAPGARVTIGYINAQPGSPNTVPGVVDFTVDLRHPDTEPFQSMQSACEQSISAACENYGLDNEVNLVWEAPGVTFDSNCIESVRSAVAAQDYTAIDMISGAGHDACNIAAVAPISMIFIPCDGGLSHNEAENINQQQAEAGANILLHAILDASRD
jgi:N-carbamoyl-L-amino-acid hydrolase|tara:strand:+ start:3196 stop:4380 length:1185 start_codon:yes stop_codon:yes gene_type:complete